MTAARVALQVTAADLMIFAGVDPEQVRQMMREGRGEIHVPAPPKKPALPLGPLRRRRAGSDG
jgi:hypothetical protein